MTLTNRTTILPGSVPCPNGWVTIRRRRDGMLMHTPAWAWARIEGKTEVADRVELTQQGELF